MKIAPLATAALLCVVLLTAHLEPAHAESSLGTDTPSIPAVTPSAVGPPEASKIPKGEYLDKDPKDVREVGLSDAEKMVTSIPISETDFAEHAAASDVIRMFEDTFVVGPSSGTPNLADTELLPEKDENSAETTPATAPPALISVSAHGSTARTKGMGEAGALSRTLRKLFKGKAKKRSLSRRKALSRSSVMARRDRQIVFYLARRYARRRLYHLNSVSQYVVVFYETATHYRWRAPYVYRGHDHTEIMAIDDDRFEAANIPAGTHTIYVYTTNSPCVNCATALVQIANQLAAMHPAINLVILYNRPYITRDGTNHLPLAIVVMNGRPNLQMYQIRAGRAGRNFRRYVEHQRV